MLINADASQLEWRVVAHLANDKTAITEILEGRDFHSENQKHFGMPPGKEGRLIAKIFLFRAIYRGPAFSYAADPLFSHLGGQKYWQSVIDAFYEKYEGIAAYHESITAQAISTGKVVMETGRIYEFSPVLRRGEWVWPITDIANYPVQGTSADIMAIIRVGTRRRLGNLLSPKCLFINTVHDSVVLDVDNDKNIWYNTCIAIEEAFKNAAKEYEVLFNTPLRVPMACEIKVGYNWLQMHKIKVKK